MIRRPPRSTLSSSSAASDVYKRQNLHGIIENGEIIRGLDVLAYSYELVGLGWVYYPLKIKFLSPLFRLVYRYWAKYRLQITGRSNIEKLCTSKCEQ